jgi:hypothetical protein
VTANTHCIHLTLNVSLQTAERHYTLFGLITLPIRVTSDTFVWYFVITHISDYNTINRLTCCSQNQVLADATKAVLLLAKPTSQFTIIKLINVNQVSFSKQKVLTNCVEGHSWYTKIPYLFNDMVRYVFIIRKTIPSNASLHEDQRQVTPHANNRSHRTVRNLTGCHIKSTELHTFPNTERLMQGSNLR